jgi:uncharacterized Zn-binding protein involved in type VI secretion
MASVAVNPPKTPVTKGSMGIAAATLPNVCKMPGPPAPFVPTPLPNIGKSGDSPKGYSTTVKIEGNPVAIKGATFGSMGDIASKGTGGGIVSSNTHGPTKFIAPGSMNVKIQGKNVQYLGDQMLNNCGPSGSPANSATLAGTVQAPAIAGMTVEEAALICECFCECQAAYDAGTISGPGCCSSCLQQKLEKRAPPHIKSEQSFFMPRNPAQAPELLTPQRFQQLATSLQGSRLFNFVSGLVRRGVPVSAGGSVRASAGIRLSRALRRLPAAAPNAGRVVRPDIIIQRPGGNSVFDAKFRWKKGRDVLSRSQMRDYQRIDKDGNVETVDGEKCGCP